MNMSKFLIIVIKHELIKHRSIVIYLVDYIQHQAA
ncbi:hypothetical protein V12B01_13160 [Vibrio splendidus 12B01]|nr:hypothetical protein V12B01_13160 [Vibrio splendidus 12B01]